MNLLAALTAIEPTAKAITDGTTTWVANGGTSAGAFCIAEFTADDITYMASDNRAMYCCGMLPASVYMGSGFICLLDRFGYPVWPAFIQWNT